MEPQVSDVVELMRQRHGLDVSRFDETFLAKSAAKRQAALGKKDAADYAERLAEDRQEAETFFASLLVSHSEFFRDPVEFALLEKVLLTNLVRQAKQSGRKEIRVWSAGCAAGPEPWSVAILLDEIVAAHGDGLGFRIFATDVSESNLEAARRGVYHAAAMQNVRLRHLEKYFSRQGDLYTVASQLREGVDFSLHDLLDARTRCPAAAIFGDFDLVLCCNVMLYYRPAPRRVILGKVSHCLRPGGYFITGASERDVVQENAGGLRAVAPPAAVFERLRWETLHENR